MAPVIDKKPAWASKTFWGWAVMVLSYFFTSVDFSALLEFGNQTIETGVFSLAAALVVFGRFVASVQLKLWNQ